VEALAAPDFIVVCLRNETMSKEKPHDALLDRDKPVADVREHFSDAIELLRDITNYGTNLIVRCFATGKRQLEDAIILGVILRQAVAMFDAFEILVSNASIYPSQLQARALLEASLYLDFILKSDTIKKATSYYVANLREQRVWALRTQSGSSENLAFEKTMEPFGMVAPQATATMQGEGAKLIAEIDRVLAQADLKDENKALEDYKVSKGGKFEPRWYAPFLVASRRNVSVRQVAVEVGRLHEYELFYSLSSEVMHSTKHTHHIKFKADQIHFEPLRHLEGISQVLNFAIATIIRIYMKVLEHYRPGEIGAFRRKYVEDWRQAFRSIKSVNYVASEGTQVI